MFPVGELLDAWQSIRVLYCDMPNSGSAHLQADANGRMNEAGWSGVIRQNDLASKA
jgi:hypothetical protein